ncbi:MAG: arginyltransferase [Gammaproteobacteria bacterium]|nr:arginyltransferase [Gammaproteobacteria bacterium]
MAIERVSSARFFLTPGHDCGYFDDREAATLLLDPAEAPSNGTYGTLSEAGFRRGGPHIYRPHCIRCRACVPTRVPVDRFRWNRRFRRIDRRNADTEKRVEPAEFREEHYDLYARYIEGRHADGSMYPPSRAQFRSFLLAPWSRTLFLCTYLDGALAAVAVTDVLPDALSAIYTYFDPALPRRSLGVYSILHQIEECRRRRLAHLYLGFWIEDAPKMRYKTDFRPVELLEGGRWAEMT